MELEQILELHDDIVKHLSILHDVIYDRVDKLFEEHDLCGINNGKCLRGYFCCSKCEHLSPDGCTIRSLACKLFICSAVHHAAREHNKEVLEEILLLRDLAKIHSITSFRGTKEEVFDRFVAKKEV